VTRLSAKSSIFFATPFSI